MTAASQNAAEVNGFDVRRIMDFLPHRYPFLMVDRVVSYVPKKMLSAYKCVTMNEPFFQGHFPGMPVMPGVLIVEAMAQAGGLLVLAAESEEFVRNHVFLFTGIENVRIRRPVVPGDRLDLCCELTRQKMTLWKMHGTARVDGALVAEGDLTAAVVPREGRP